MKDLIEQIVKEFDELNVKNGFVLDGNDPYIKKDQVRPFLRSSLEKAYEAGKEEGIVANVISMDEETKAFRAIKDEIKAQTLKDLREKIEGMSTETEKYHAEKMYKQGRFDALTDLLTALQAHNKKV